MSLIVTQLFDYLPLTYLLGTFLYNNYKQALAILDTRSTVLIALESVGGRDGSVVEGWLKEEEAYLCGLTKEPPHETLEMEYYGWLVALSNSE